MMDEVMPGLWIGDLSSALDVEKLRAHKIFSILTAMRGKVTIHEVIFSPYSFSTSDH
jgi:dual specificity phosphatase 12